MAKSTQILEEVSQLILSVENSNIQKVDKLKIIKVLFTIKLKLFELLEEETKMEAKLMHQASMVKDKNYNIQTSNKQNLIIQFIKEKSGRVSAADLLSLGIAGRSLRRYIKNLTNGKKIKVEKSGRNYFYLLA